MNTKDFARSLTGLTDADDVERRLLGFLADFLSGYGVRHGDGGRGKAREEAERRGCFWLPCVLCGKWRGGHEPSGPGLYLEGRGGGICVCDDEACATDARRLNRLLAESPGYEAMMCRTVDGQEEIIPVAGPLHFSGDSPPAGEAVIDGGPEPERTSVRHAFRDYAPLCDAVGSQLQVAGTTAGVTCPECRRLMAAKEAVPRTVAVNTPEAWTGFPPVVWEERGNLTVSVGPPPEPLPDTPAEPPPGFVPCDGSVVDAYRSRPCVLAAGHEGPHRGEA